MTFIIFKMYTKCVTIHYILIYSLLENFNFIICFFMDNFCITSSDFKKSHCLVKPFIKWAGGKNQLIQNISKLYPAQLGTRIKNYVEPFIGGGAILFDILNKYELEKIYINDINPDLINLYITIKENVEKLISLLKIYETLHISLNMIERRNNYIKNRELFNTLNLHSSSSRLEKACLFIFLNKTCFNGLYRVNKKGNFNVPMGNYKNPLICDTENLLNVSNKLKKVEIHCGDYIDTEKFIDNKTFVYLDPPYRPLTKTSNFTSYNEFIFDDKEQIKLSQFATKIKEKGAKVLLSNSDPKNNNVSDNFFEDIYKNFDIKRVYANRNINSKSACRGKIAELLISS